MKYSGTTIIIILSLYLSTLIFGLYVSDIYASAELPYGMERPDIDEQYSVPYFFGAIILATTVYLILSRYSLHYLIKIWYFLAIFLAVTVALSPFVGGVFASLIAVVFILAKVFGESIWIHNFVEVLVYAGIVPLFSPIFNVSSVIILIILMGIYDFISVYKTKHMIKLAEGSRKTGVFSGLLVKYKDESAILGGGDIAFPLLFAVVVHSELGFVPAIFSIYGAAIGLLSLIIYGKEKKYYPAIPFIALGMFVGFLTGRLL